MNTEEFAKAVDKVSNSMDAARKSRTSEAIAHMYLDMALNGLVASPLVLGEPFPIPLCRMVYLPSETDTASASFILNSYIYPSDQVK